MGWITTSILLMIITMVLLCANVKDYGELEFKFRKRMLFALCWLLLILFGCFSTVKTGEIGIKTKFGKITNVTRINAVIIIPIFLFCSSSVMFIVFKSPLEKVIILNLKIQKYENEKELDTSTKDLQIVSNIKVSVNYQIQGDKAIALYKNVGTNYKENILEPAIQETIKATISQYTAEELVTKRSEVSLKISENLNNRIKDYGIKCVAISIKNFDFSTAYNQAIEQKAVAEQNVLKAQQELEKSKIDAEKKIVEAEATNKANELLRQNTTDEVLTKQFIEKWNGQLPTTYAGDDILGIFNLK